MMNTTRRINAVLKYPGAKWRIADWIIEKMPEHHGYLEPYFGSGAVFFRKKPSKIETINDLDGDVTNLFSIIRDNPEPLIKAVTLTPYSRREYEAAFAGEPENKLEQARRFLIKCWQGHGFRTNGKSGWKHDVQGREAAYAMRDWYRLPGWIADTVERLREVQIENRPALEIIHKFNYPNVLIYADPPYLLSTRKMKKQYACEMTEADHRMLLEALLEHKGPVLLSGYDSELYNRYLDEWDRYSLDTTAEHGKPRTEIPWVKT